jgi:hypothetical protein
MPGGVIVDSDHALSEREKVFEEIGPDETGYSGNHPGAGIGQQLLSKTEIRCGDHELTEERVPAGPIQSIRAREHVYPIKRAASAASAVAAEGIFHSPFRPRRRSRKS